MAIVAEFTIPPDAILGGETLQAMPEVTIELERVVPTEESALPFFWTFGGDPDTFFSKIRREPEIEEIQVLADVGDAALFSAMWTPDVEVIRGIRQLGATIMEATGTADEWYFRVRAENRERLLEFQEIFHKQDIPVQLRRINDLAELMDSEHPLTDEQRATLLVAFEEGYFDQPRQVTQTELGDHFGISSQAVATRLQRGIRNLIRSTIADRVPERTGRP